MTVLPYAKGMATRGKRRIQPHAKIRRLVGENLARILLEKQVTAQEAANRAKIDRRTIDRMRNGEYAGNLDSLGALADAVEVSYLDFFIPRPAVTPALTGKGEELIHGKNLKLAPRNRGHKDKR